jgi:hypothetical protein
MLMDQSRPIRPARLAMPLVLAGLLTGCLFQESLPSAPVTIINDTDRSVEIWIEFEGQRHKPRDGDTSLTTGEQSTISLTGPWTVVNDPGIVCSDGPVVARDEAGSEIRVPAPICSGTTINLSEYPRMPAR